jgi:hypothetical protein
MKRLPTLTCVLAASIGLAACGGSDEKKSSSAPPATETTATAETTPTTPPTAAGGTVDLMAFVSCIEDSGSSVKPQPDKPDGLQGTAYQVRLGEGDFDEPSKEGTFKFFGYVYVFDTPANAEKFDGFVTGSRFQDGEVKGSVYLGYNTDAAKVPDTPEGDTLSNCLGARSSES